MALKNAAGTTLSSYAHDLRGNLASRTEGGTTYTFTFDEANRLRSTTLSASSYDYDGLGRRTRETSNGLATYYQYSRAGQLLYVQDGKQDKFHGYVYLSGSLVAKRSVPVGGGAAAVRYQHTDGLGSLVAASDEAGVVVRRERMTAYGEPVDGAWDNGHGFTGHQNDAATELVYMQQRYYDPVIGQFVSADPMASDLGAGWNSNRYNYAANSPYGFVDPDGRMIRLAGESPWDHEEGPFRNPMRLLGEWRCSLVCLSDTATPSQSNGESGKSEKQAYADALGPDRDAISLTFNDYARSTETYLVNGWQTNGEPNVLLQPAQTETPPLLGGKTGLVRSLFGKGGILNSGKHLRIGVGREGGKSVFRIAGSSLARIPKPLRDAIGVKEIKPGVFKLDLWKRGDL